MLLYYTCYAATLGNIVNNVRSAIYSQLSIVPHLAQNSATFAHFHSHCVVCCYCRFVDATLLHLLRSYARQHRKQCTFRDLLSTFNCATLSPKFSQIRTFSFTLCCVLLLQICRCYSITPATQLRSATS